MNPQNCTTFIGIWTTCDNPFEPCKKRHVSALNSYPSYKQSMSAFGNNDICSQSNVVHEPTSDRCISTQVISDLK